ncbi:MAG: hypothetical protein FWD79_12470 [Desulfobulbus sp.]|nr:hypothetical protein [Desulfobulbus sp.]
MENGEVSMKNAVVSNNNIGERRRRMVGSHRLPVAGSPFLYLPVALFFCLFAGQARAQDIPDGTNLYPTYTGSAASTTTWTLQGNAYLSDLTNASAGIPLPSGLM